MISAFFLILIISTALLFGNEFSIGFFIHPSLARADHRAFLPAIQVFAGLFGKIMPIWMPATLLLHLLLLWLTWRWPANHTVFLISAVILWIISIVLAVSATSGYLFKDRTVQPELSGEAPETSRRTPGSLQRLPQKARSERSFLQRISA